ncbi:hydantoinase B/oxoprolinase family protein [Pseudonocardia sp. MCCB 268]|nr:hydantoinase B/oxoprolinase family protein [Pseudonocardia cytotoxica]
MRDQRSGDDVHPGDISSSTTSTSAARFHFNDTCVVRPISLRGRAARYAQANGHWADVGGAAPGLLNVTALATARRPDPAGPGVARTCSPTYAQLIATSPGRPGTHHRRHAGPGGS